MAHRTFREAFHLLAHQFIINEYNLRDVDEEMPYGWCIMGKGVGPSCAECTTLLDLQLFTNPGGSWNSCSEFYGSLIIQEQLNYWPLGIDSNFCPSLPRGHGGWTGKSQPLITWLLFWQLAYTFLVVQSHLIEIHHRKIQEARKFCVRNGTEQNNIVSSWITYITTSLLNIYCFVWYISGKTTFT